VQKLTGCIAALNMFIMKLAKKVSLFQYIAWLHKSRLGTRAEQAFDDLKHYLEHLPTLSSPKQGQPLILYISAMHSVVSRAMVVEKEIKHKDKIVKQQFLMYFVSEVPHGVQNVLF
jgi:hypothetical protein